MHSLSSGPQDWETYRPGTQVHAMAAHCPAWHSPGSEGPPRADAGGSREVSMMWLTCSRIHIDEGARSVHGSGSQGPGLGCTVQGGAPASVSRETRGGALGSGGGTRKPWLGRCREPTLAWLFRPGPWTLPRRLGAHHSHGLGCRAEGPQWTGAPHAKPYTHPCLVSQNRNWERWPRGFQPGVPLGGSPPGGL